MNIFESTLYVFLTNEQNLSINKDENEITWGRALKRMSLTSSLTWTQSQGYGVKYLPCVCLLKSILEML